MACSAMREWYLAKRARAWGSGMRTESWYVDMAALGEESGQRQGLWGFDGHAGRFFVHVVLSGAGCFGAETLRTWWVVQPVDATTSF